jgi:hypothetical protein
MFTHSFTVWSPWGNWLTFSAAEAIHTVSFVVPPDTHYCCVARFYVECTYSLPKASIQDRCQNRTPIPIYLQSTASATRPRTHEPNWRNETNALFHWRIWQQIPNPQNHTPADLDSWLQDGDQEWQSVYNENRTWTISCLWWSSPWGNWLTFSAAEVILTVSFVVPPCTHYCWVTTIKCGYTACPRLKYKTGFGNRTPRTIDLRSTASSKALNLWATLMDYLLRNETIRPCFIGWIQIQNLSVPMANLKPDSESYPSRFGFSDSRWRLKLVIRK